MRPGKNGTVYIYGLHSPDDTDIMYVGSTSNPRSRLNSHAMQKDFTPASKYHNHKYREWINNLLCDGLRPQMVILEQCAESDRKQRECYWISHYAQRNPDLTNYKTPTPRKTFSVAVLSTQDEYELICANFTPEQRTELLLSAIASKQTIA